MKLIALAIAIIFYSVIKTLFLVDVGGLQSLSMGVPEMPDFTVPGLLTPPTGGGIANQLGKIAVGIINFVLYIVAVVVFAVKLVVFLLSMVAFILVNGFSPVPGAPALVNLIVYGPLGFILGVAVYRAIRKGDAAA